MPFWHPTNNVNALNANTSYNIHQWPWPWPWIGSRSYQHIQYVQDYQYAQASDYSLMRYRNMAIWISRSIDIGQSLNSCDSFPRWKFQNRAPTSCRPDPILSPPAISFELHAKMLEIGLEKCNVRDFGSSMTLTLTLDPVDVILVCICGRGLLTRQIRSKSEKLFVDVRTDRHTWVSNQAMT